MINIWLRYGSNKMENIKYHTVGKFPRSNRKIVETEAKSLLLAHIYMTPNTHILLIHIYMTPNTYMHDP